MTQSILPSDFPIGLNTTSLGQFIPELAKAYPNRPMQLALAAYAPKPATMTCATTGFNVTFSLFVGADVILANGSVVEAFKLRADIIGAGKAWIGESARRGVEGQLPALDTSTPRDPLSQSVVPMPKCAHLLPSSRETVHRSAPAPSLATIEAAEGTKSSLAGNLTFLEVPLSLEKSSIGNITAEVQGLQEIAALLAATYIIPALNSYLNKGFPLPIVDGVALVNPAVNFRAGYLEVETDFKYTPSAIDAMRRRAWIRGEQRFVRRGDEPSAPLPLVPRSS